MGSSGTFAVMAAAALAAAPLLGYDLHTRALTPIVEKPVPEGGAVTLVEDGRLRFAIETDDEKRDAQAIALLREVFLKTTGRTPEIRCAPDGGAMDAAKADAAPDADAMPSRIVLAAEPALPPEGFSIETAPGRVSISGHTYFGALDFAERFLGVRWYFPGENGSIYPECRDLSIEPVRYEDAPYYQSRGGRFYVSTSFRSDELLKHWEPYLGAVGPDDVAFVKRWRDGGTLPKCGEHNPRPECIAASHPDKLETIFYTSPAGKFWYNPKAHFGNVFNVLDLSFADMLVEDWRAYYGGGRRKEADRGGFGELVNDQFVTFGVCDTYLPLGEVLDHPLVKALGLITEADLARDKDAAMANIYGRFYQYLARRVGEAFPDKRLVLLCYYNSKCPSLDPRWALPGNVEANVCDVRLPTRTRDAAQMAGSRQLFREWREVLGRPALKAWLYCGRTRFGRAMGPEFIGEVPKILGDDLGRGGVFYDFDGGHDLWHYFYSAYVGWRSQWNPDFDVEAALDELWRLCLGEAAGAKMKAFHDALKEAFVRYQACSEAGGLPEPRYPLDVIGRLEALLAEAEALVAPGGVEMKRFRLIADYWPEAFAQQRAQAAYRPPVYAVRRLAAGEAPILDGVPDEPFWEAIEPMPMINRFDGSPAEDCGSLKLAWSRDGLYAAYRFEGGAPKTGGDLWANDTLEFFLSPGQGREFLHQLAFDAGGQEFAMRHRLLPIQQPADVTWTAPGHVFRAQATGTGWTAELYLPFSVFDDGAPGVGDRWHFNFAATRRGGGGEKSASTSLTGQRHANIQMWGVIRF